MGLLNNLGRSLGIGGGGSAKLYPGDSPWMAGLYGTGGGAETKLPAGNSQWSQLANFFPDDSLAGKAAKPNGNSVDIASILGALQSLNGGHEQPPPPPAIDWPQMPAPRMLPSLQSAPRINPGQMMLPPAWMQPYLWGVR